MKLNRIYVLIFAAVLSGGSVFGVETAASGPASRPADVRKHVDALLEQRRYGEAAPLLAELLKSEPDRADNWYDEATVEARQGKKDKALASLNQALDKGWVDFTRLRRDESFQGLRELPAFKALLGRQDEVQKKRARITLGNLSKKYGDGLLYEIDDKLKIIFATDADRRVLEEIKERLTAHATALQKDLFAYGLDNYLPVVIPKKWANPKVTGHFYGNFVDARAIGSDLMHEFTHALHWADQMGRGQEHPVWMMEGMASLYEDSRVVDGHAVPRPNYRLIELQNEVRGGHFVPFEKMMKFEHRQFTSVHYAQARYMFMYLFDTGKLAEWYKTYTAGFEKDRTGIEALEKTYGKKLGEIERDWCAWLLKLTPPKMVLGPGAASLGVRTSQQPAGVKIDETIAGGAAATAGLQAGDVLMRIDNERTWGGEDLVEILGQHKAGDKVKLEYNRAGEYHTIDLTLMALPAATEPAPSPAAGKGRTPPVR